jgi:hypothetical protein
VVHVKRPPVTSVPTTTAPDAPLALVLTKKQAKLEPHAPTEPASPAALDGDRAKKQIGISESRVPISVSRSPSEDQGSLFGLRLTVLKGEPPPTGGGLPAREECRGARLTPPPARYIASQEDFQARERERLQTAMTRRRNIAALPPVTQQIIKDLGDEHRCRDLQRRYGDGVGLERFIATTLRGENLRFGNSVHTKNVVSAKAFEELMYCRPDNAEDVEGALRDSPCMVLARDTGRAPSYLLIRKGAEGAEVYNDRRGSFEPLTDDHLEEFGVTDDVRVGFADPPIDDRVEHTFDEPTTGPVANGARDDFYLESQRGGQCGLHAFNAMIGGRSILPSGLTAFNDQELVKSGTVLSKTNPDRYDPKAFVLEADAGNDPAMLVKYTRELAGHGRVDASFSTLVDEQGKPGELRARVAQIEGTHDRCAIGSMIHFVAFRKDAQGAWWMLDSLQDHQIRQTPSEYLATRNRQQRLDFIHT